MRRRGEGGGGAVGDGKGGLLLEGEIMSTGGRGLPACCIYIKGSIPYSSQLCFLAWGIKPVYCPAN